MIIRRTLLGASFAAPALTACATAPAPIAQSLPLPHDPHSHARPAEARVTHVSLDLATDFERKALTGTATLTIEARADAREIVLDSDGLIVKSVRTNLGETSFEFGSRDENLGQALTIAIGPGVSTLVIAYETAPGAGALQWLEPAQTASGKRFLFSQGQAILTRTWVPTQDSPGIRQTYDARIVAPEGLKAVMSAEMLTPNGEAAVGGRAFRFRMSNPIPPYLIALAVGDLSFQAIGPRTGVYAEPSVIERAAYECADMERMLRAAEAMYGRYRWGRYDVLVLPPSFPYGGMENPRLTFLTPTFLAGDRSLVSLIAHELAHSWSGNLVTNALWADSWLNEGFTSYFEGRIVEALYGEENAAMQFALAWADIQKAIAAGPPDDTRLHLTGQRSADDGVSAIVYDKGALFLRTMERELSRTRFDAYLRSYFDRHAFQPMTTQWFMADFRDRAVRGDAALEARLQLDAWCYEPGLPSNAEEPRAAAFDRVAAQVTAFNAGGPASAIPWADWGTFERQRFLQILPRELSAARLAELEGALGLNATGNAEVLFDWLSLAIANRAEASMPAVEHFLTSLGRGKFVRPLYRALMGQGEWGQAHARRIYALARAGYHPIVQTAVDGIVTPA
ncbi:MAG TPA: aminopeptidase [Hyphomonadaceae bacterium]|nr:aminopeptidase [Hyphomonadaceae bacterium]